jgi:hypothetical protein
MTHLSPDELIDAMEADAGHSETVGMLAPARQSHLAACEACQRELAALSAAFNDARRVSVPEPSPLFWQHFSERVRVAIDHDTAPGRNRPAWLRWQVLAPVGALALLLLALTIAVPKPEADTSMLNDVASLEPARADDNWVMLANLVGDIDLDTASAAGVIEPGVAERAVLALTAEEQQELTRLLMAELTRAKS